MGSILYDFLDDSFLFAQKNIENSLGNISDAELSAELQRYRDFCLKNIPMLASEIENTHSDLRVFSGIEDLPVSLLKQSAFYVEQFVLYDPLFAETRPSHSQSKAFSQYLGFNSDELDRKRLASTLGTMKQLSPMIAANFVKLFPTSFFFEPPEEIPLLHSECNYADGIPEPLLHLFHGSAKVESLERVKNALVSAGKLYPCRNISVEFGEPTESMLFQLFENEIISTNEGERTAEFRMHLPETPPDKAVFDVWVQQSINRTAKNVLSRVSKEAKFATKLNSLFLTNSQFVSNLLTQTLPPKQGIPVTTANTLLNLELPFLDKVDISTLMSVRMNDGESFQNFRTELEKQFRELRLIKDVTQLKIRTDNVLHELLDVQLPQVQQKVTSLKKKSLAEAGLLVAGLAGTIQTGGWSLLASAVAAIKGYQTIEDYFQNTRQNPAFFLWKVLK